MVKADSFSLNQFNVWAATGTNPDADTASAEATVVIDVNAETVEVRSSATDIDAPTNAVLFGPADALTLPTDDGVVAVCLVWDLSLISLIS